MQAIDADYQAQGKMELVTQLRPWHMGESRYGNRGAVAATLGLSLPALKAVIHRLRSRFRQLVKAEVAGTLGQDGFVEDVIRSLFVALAS